MRRRSITNGTRYQIDGLQLFRKRYCTNMTNLAVSSHHKLCHCQIVTLVISHSENCQNFFGRSSVIIKSARSLLVGYCSSPGLPKFFSQVVGHWQDYEVFFFTMATVILLSFDHHGRAIYCLGSSNRVETLRIVMRE